MYYHNLFATLDDSDYIRPIPQGRWFARTARNHGQLPRPASSLNPPLREVAPRRGIHSAPCCDLPENMYVDMTGKPESNFTNTFAGSASNYCQMKDPPLEGDLERVHLNTNGMAESLTNVLSQPIGNSPVAKAPMDTIFPPQHPIHDKTDIPKDIVDLSVQQVCQCLMILNMPELIPKFMYAQVNGLLLCNISVNDLVEEFDMGTLKAKKLKLFANEGWRPC